MFVTTLEIVSRKLVDVLGDRAVQIVNRDKTRAASYKVYYALKRIEETYSEIITILDRSYSNISRNLYTDHELVKINDSVRSDIDRAHALLSPLEEYLEDLKNAFGALEGKLEIYASIEAAQSIRLFMGSDAHVLSALRADGHEPADLREISAGMIAASRLARDTVASFIRENYEIDQSEDGT